MDARVAESRYKDDVVLKGGVLLAAFSLRRPTKDVDLQATGLANDVDDVAGRIRELATIDVNDGLVFDPDEIRAHVIREGDDYPGVRVRLVAMLGKARLPIGIDINFGDPVWPAPSEIDLPRLVNIGQRPLRVLGYPLPMVIAEKTATILQRAEINTRWRDFVDILSISGAHGLSAADLRAALEAVATFRRVALRPLLPGLAAMPQTAQPKWANWRRRHSQGNDLPELFEKVLRAVAGFVDPVLGATLPVAARWVPVHRKWEQNGG